MFLIPLFRITTIASAVSVISGLLSFITIDGFIRSPWLFYFINQWLLQGAVTDVVVLDHLYMCRGFGIVNCVFTFGITEAIKFASSPNDESPKSIDLNRLTFQAHHIHGGRRHGIKFPLLSLGVVGNWSKGLIGASISVVTRYSTFSINAC
jgi:hypothetical protein